MAQHVLFKPIASLTSRKIRNPQRCAFLSAEEIDIERAVIWAVVIIS